MTQDDLPQMNRLNWKRITTKTAFVAAFGDKTFVDDGLRFTIHSDGQMTGEIDGQKLVGRWVWSGEYFCRTAMLDGVDLGQDCEIIEQCGAFMRYTRDKGRGAASVVRIEPS